MSLIRDLRMPIHPQRAWWRKRLLNVAKASGDASLQVAALAQAALADAHRDLPEAGATINTLKDLMHSREISSSAMISAYVSLAMYYCATGQLKDSRQSAEAGLALAKRTGIRTWDFPCHFWIAVACFVTGDLDKSSETFRHMAAQPVARAAFGAQYCQQLASWRRCGRAIIRKP